MEIGKRYKVTHSRKGIFILRVTKIVGVWLTGIIEDGTAEALLEENVREKGEEITVRISHIRKHEEVLI